MDIPSTSYSLLSDLNENGESGSAWAAFDARYRPVIHTWCQRRGLNGDAEDMTQEILIKLFRTLPGHVHDQEKGPFRSWLKTVVENTLRDYWRKKERHPEPVAVGGSTFLGSLGNWPDLEEAIECLSTAISVAAEASASAIVRRARSRVNEKTWQSFEQTAFEKRPAAEVARELSLTTSAVFKNAYRVKQILREETERT